MKALTLLAQNFAYARIHVHAQIEKIQTMHSIIMHEIAQLF